MKLLVMMEGTNDELILENREEITIFLRGSQEVEEGTRVHEEEKGLKDGFTGCAKEVGFEIGIGDWVRIILISVGMFSLRISFNGLIFSIVARRYCLHPVFLKYQSL